MDNLDRIGTHLGKKIDIEIRNATAQFKKSAFESDNKDHVIESALLNKASKSELKNLNN